MTAKILVALVIAGAFVVGHEFGYQDALVLEQMQKEHPVKTYKPAPAKAFRAAYPWLPKHLQCPAFNGRGWPLADWIAHQRDGGEWEISCEYSEPRT